jgi:NADH:ubiquinone oxidoreductase subunit F (NADH-binding)
MSAVVSSELVAEVGRAGLTGRGGAAFPVARKLAAVSAAGGYPVVVANGTEGEPASAKDKVLAATQPHLILDGAVLAAGICGAARVFVVVDRAVTDVMEHAVAERESAGIDRPRLHVVTAAGGFVSGEASAVVQWLEHGTPLPRATPPRLAERGLAGQPTLVHNVETLAHLALIARYGAGWFRTAGTPGEPGTMLVTVTGAVRRPSVHEIAIGYPLSSVIALAGGPAGTAGGPAGTASSPPSAVLVGGYSGSWVKWPDAARLPLSAAGLAEAGASPGAGVIAVLPSGVCPLAETASLARYLAAESAGQCGPCRFGLPAIAAELSALADGRRTDLRLVHRWLGQVSGRGACGHPDGAVRLIRSALSVFRAEVADHLSGWCTTAGDPPVLPVR